MSIHRTRRARGSIAATAALAALDPLGWSAARAADLNCANRAPNEIAIVAQVARDYPAEFRKADVHSEEGWWFLDRLVPVLQRKDPRWGYNCKRGDCGDLSKDVVAYNCDPGRAERSQNVAIIDVVTNARANPTVGWFDVTQSTKDARAIGRWKSSRDEARSGGGAPAAQCSTTWRGGSNDSCVVGTYHGHPPDTDRLFRWTCRRVPDSALGEKQCDAPKPSGGGTPSTPREPASAGAREPQCKDVWKGHGDESCVVGTYNRHPPDTSAEVRWTCRRTPGSALGEKRCASKWSRVGESGCPNNGHFQWKNDKCMASCGHQANLFLQHCRETGGGCAGYKVSSGGGCTSPDAGWAKVEDLEAHDVGTCCLLGPAAASNPAGGQDNAGDENRDVSSVDGGGGNQPECYAGGKNHGDADCR